MLRDRKDTAEAYVGGLVGWRVPTLLDFTIFRDSFSRSLRKSLGRQPENLPHLSQWKYTCRSICDPKSRDSYNTRSTYAVCGYYLHVDLLNTLLTLHVVPTLMDNLCWNYCEHY